MFPIDIDFSRLKEVLTYDPQAPMIFSSGIFLWLFAAFMVVYVLLQRKYTARIMFVTLIGMFLYGLGFLMEGALPWFAPVLLAQVVWGCGDTFTVLINSPFCALVTQ